MNRFLRGHLNSSPAGHFEARGPWRRRSSPSPASQQFPTGASLFPTLASLRLRRPWTARLSYTREQKKTSSTTAAEEAMVPKTRRRREEGHGALALNLTGRAQLDSNVGNSEEAKADAELGVALYRKILLFSGIWPQT